LCQLFVKYNGVLRAAKHDAPTLFKKRASELCRGNTYAATLHVLTKALVALSQLTTVSPVYRGMSGGWLPAAFTTPDEYGCTGGVEMGFMSTVRTLMMHCARALSTAHAL
jgi:hypothetical protein